MKHLVRAGVILLVILGGMFFALRMVPVTEPLESFGFYQGKDNSQEWASLPAQYADPQMCNQCRADKSSLWQKSPHKMGAAELFAREEHTKRTVRFLSATLVLIGVFTMR